MARCQVKQACGVIAQQNRTIICLHLTSKQLWWWPRLWLITYKQDLLGGQGSALALGKKESDDTYDHYVVVQCLAPSACAELETTNELTEQICGRLSSEVGFKVHWGFHALANLLSPACRSIEHSVTYIDAARNPVCQYINCQMRNACSGPIIGN